MLSHFNTRWRHCSKRVFFCLFKRNIYFTAVWCFYVILGYLSVYFLLCRRLKNLKNMIWIFKRNNELVTDVYNFCNAATMGESRPHIWRRLEPAISGEEALFRDTIQPNLSQLVRKTIWPIRARQSTWVNAPLPHPTPSCTSQCFDPGLFRCCCCRGAQRHSAFSTDLCGSHMWESHGPVHLLYSVWVRRIIKKNVSSGPEGFPIMTSPGRRSSSPGFLIAPQWTWLDF